MTRMTVQRIWPALLVVLGVAVGPLAAADEAAENRASDPPGRPNVLWIVAEDMGSDLGIYGNPDVRTPRVDALAREGVLYEHAFTTAPVCSPSRSAFSTGMYQTTIGAHHHRSHRSDDFALPDGVEVISDWMREAGYFTGNLVKLSGKSEAGPGYRGTGKDDWNFSYEASSEHEAPWDTKFWAELSEHRPFYAQVNLAETHRIMSDWGQGAAHLEAPADAATVSIPPYYPDHPVTRADWADYLNSIMMMDRKVGFILDRLDSEGLTEDTIVVFFADNGRAMVRGKQWVYDSGVRIPLIIRWPAGFPAPEQYRPGARDPRLVSAIDITATTLWAAGAPLPPLMQGRVFLGPDAVERRYVFSARDRADEAEERIRSVRDRRFRYIRNHMPDKPRFQRQRYKETYYPVLDLIKALAAEGRLDPVQRSLLAPRKPEEELYDLESDPYETRNLAGDRAHAATLARLRGALDTWIVETNDLGRYDEDPAVVQYWTAKMIETYGQ